MKKMLLIDGHSLIFRAFYATSFSGSKMTMQSYDGVPTNAIYALANMLNRLLSETTPDYALVALDSSGPTFRHEFFADYKAGRKEAPPELISQFPLAIELFEKMGFQTFQKETIEADDIIGTVAKKAANQQIKVEIFSGDKDLFQLIDDSIVVKFTKRGMSELDIMDFEGFKKEYEGLVPKQLIDLKGLMGDASDNIPGIKGVGEKTALKLLKEYHTLENVLEAPIKGKMGERIKESKDLAHLSKKLATINCNVSLDFDIDTLIYGGQKEEALAEFYQRYHMHSLLRRMASKIEDEKIEFEIVTEIPSDLLNNDSNLVLEYEGDNYHRNEIIGLGISFKEKSFFIKTSDLVNDYRLKEYLKNDKYSKGTYDVKSVIVTLNRLNIEINNLNFDLILAAYLLQPALKEEPAVIYNYFGYQVEYLKNIYTKKGYELETLAEYVCKKAFYLNSIKPKAFEMLTKEKSLSLYEELELPLAKVLADMEITGISLDTNFLNEKSEEVQIKLNELTTKIYNLAGEKFNINSPSQVANILFDKLLLPTYRQRTTSAEALNYLKAFHPIVEYILEYRRYAKLQSTYLQSLPQYVLDDGKIHTIYNQALTQTGRLSSKEPNMQNISIRDEESREIRKAFIASKQGSYILSFDYSQIELRVLAHIANANSMIKAFNEGKDIHSLTASSIFGVDPSSVNEDMRRQAKTINFGIVYGMSEWGLKDELGISVQEAKIFIEKYFETYKEIKEYFDNVISECKKTGYVKTYFNRIRYVNEINDSNYNVREFGKRIAMNSPIQGTAADIIKKAMLKIAKALKDEKLKTKMLLQVHDELIFEVPYDELMSVIPLILEIMENIVEFKVKLVANYSYGYNWYDAK